MALPLGNFALALGALTAFYAISMLWTRVWPLLKTPLRNLRGPKNDSLIWGNLKTVFASENAVIYEAWLKEYGKAFSYHAFFGKYRLFTTDTRAIAHIFSNSHIWVKPELARRGLASVLGEGILSAEGEQHRRQRRTMNPAFGVAQIRELTDIFLEKSAELRDIWRAQVTAGGGEARVDALSSMSKAALDIIGVAGFDYHFDALKERQNELSDAFKEIFSAATPRVFDILKEFIPGFKWIPDQRTRTADNARETMNRIGMELINEKKRAIRGGDSKSAGRDLLSLLIRANMDKDVPPHLRLTDEEVLGQVPTFLVAGHETTATTTAWCLYALSIHPEIQTQLRDELLAVLTENPTMDDLNALPYLDAVVRETLRLYSVVASTLRAALEDDIIPLSSPITDCKGQVMNEIKVLKGDVIFVPITVLNRAEEIWGNDAHEFRPERWLNMSEKASTSIPGIFAGLATFIGGPRSCIGYRFAIVEFKALLFHVVRSFNIALAVPAEQIGHKSTLLSRPMLKTDGSNQVPLIITPVE